MPSTGQLRKITRSTGLAPESQNDRTINMFSYKELRSGVVYFVPNEVVEQTLVDMDSFEYQLLIKTVQPAQGMVHIKYRAPRDVNGNKVTMASSDFSFNYIALLVVLIVLIVCILVVMFLLKIRYLRRQFNVGER